jgi:hypothetical protein
MVGHAVIVASGLAGSGVSVSIPRQPANRTRMVR